MKIIIVMLIIVVVLDLVFTIEVMKLNSRLSRIEEEKELSNRLNEVKKRIKREWESER